MNQTPRLEATLSALEQLPAGVLREWAVRALEYWQNQFPTATDSETQNIAKHLAELRHLLEQNFGARAIGSLLVRQGAGTIAVALKAGRSRRGQLGRLGGLLVAAGERLGSL